MKLYRYVIVSDETIDVVNRLLTAGWRPVRETGLSQRQDEGFPGQGAVLVLCERDAEFPQHSGEMFAGNVPLEFLAEVPLFGGLTIDELRQVIARCEVVEHSAGDAVFREGDVQIALYVVLEGEVRIQLPELPLEQAEPIDLTARDAFGEVAFFTGSPHGASAICATDIRLLRWDRDVYDEFVQAGHPLAYKVGMNAAAILAQRLRATDGWVWDLVSEEQSSRIASSWRRFRTGLTRPTNAPGGFFGV